MPQNQEFQFDVFLSHNSKNKPVVRELKKLLGNEGLRVWLDEDELVPGMSWQQLLEVGIRASKSVAVLVGKDGLGPWEIEEMEAALILAVNKKKPVIPTLLPGALTQPELPMFLGNRTWVDMRHGLTVEVIDNLIWGVTGSKPNRSLTNVKLSSSKPDSGIRIRCRLSCRDKLMESFHTRPAAFIRTLCHKFPRTTFRVCKEADWGSQEAEASDPKEIISMLLGCFQHGDILILEVHGELEMKAATFLKIALENIEGYSDYPEETKTRIAALIDDANNRMYEPDLDDWESRMIKDAKEALVKKDKEYRFIAIINDRLHDISLPVIPLVAKHFACNLQISFELPMRGIYVFNIESKDDYKLDSRITEHDIEVGTRITIVPTGERAEEVGISLKNILENLWQCDQWIRNRGKDSGSAIDIFELVKFAKEMARHSTAEYGYVQNPFISNLVTRNHVFVNGPGRKMEKDEILRQLATPHASLYDLQLSDILKRVNESESRQIVVLRPGFAFAHAAMDRSPRISISFGTYIEGVSWGKHEGMVNLVVMGIYAQDTIRTWRDYLKKFSKMFRSIPALQDELVACRTGEEFLGRLRKAEISMGKL